LRHEKGGTTEGGGPLVLKVDIFEGHRLSY